MAKSLWNHKAIGRVLTRWALAAIVVMITGCAPPVLIGPVPSPTPSVLDTSRLSLQVWSQPQLEALGPLPEYFIQARLTPAADRLEGRVRVRVPNNDTAPWPDLVFRLYPNLPHYGGAMRVADILVDAKPVAPELVADGSALRLPLPVPLAAGGEITVEMSFDVDLPQRASGYTLFGWEDGILSLPGFYPSLAVRNTGGGDWAIETPPLFADALFNPVALYDLSFSAPAGLTLVASGTTADRSTGQNGEQIWHIVGGPLRDMTVLASDRWEAVSDTGGGAAVTSYYPAGLKAAGQAALSYATAALRLYSDLFGQYPYAEFDVVAAPLSYRGMEYSGLVTIGEDLYSRYRDQLAFLVAHETAHQWWYVQVGNDPLYHAWLDEGLAEYAAFDYYRGVYGQSAAEELLSAQWEISYSVAAARGIDGPVDQSASAMNPDNYELLAYAKAALFFNALREELGEETYFNVLRAYVETYRWQVVTPQHFFASVQVSSGANLNPLAEEWLR